MVASEDAELIVVALARIDAANAADPNRVPDPDSDPDDAPGRDVRSPGPLRPKELVHAERMTHWLAILDPAASPAQVLAARAHHFRRWLCPREDFAPGRAGYLAWRKAARERHAIDVEELLSGVGISPELRADTSSIIAKRGLGRDPRVQTHEDALCLVFFELQAAATVQRLGEGADRVIAKTVAKMSPRARSIASGFDLPAAVVELIEPGRVPGTLSP